MKVLLIQPFSDESNNNYPPMGLLYIAAYLQANTNHEIKIFDLRVKRTPVETILTRIRQWNPDIVGITGMSIESMNIKHIAQFLKQNLRNETTFIIGGPHASIFKKKIMLQLPFDFLVKGEGEETFLELLTAIQDQKDFSQIKGLVYRTKEGAVFETEDRDMIANIDDIPFPAYNLIHVDDYFESPHFHGNLNVSKRVLPLITSRGCPFHCSFCHHAFGFKFRPRSADNVIQEIEFLCENFKIKEIQIEDDTFNMNSGRAQDIMQQIMNRKFNVSIVFPNGIRGDLLDQDSIDLYKKAGVYRIHFGIESINSRIQKIVNKAIDVDKLNNAIRLANKANISTHGFFIFGFPTETSAEILESIEYAAHSKLATANFSLLKLFPGTPLFEEYLKNDEKYTDDFSFSYDSTSTNLSMVSDDDLKKLQKTAMVRFYLRPSRIWRIFWTTPNKVGLFTKNLKTVAALIFKGKAKY
jgi:anaerobic magnesium-protoporphyrin IX monomethyl ester cyclase